MKAGVNFLAGYRSSRIIETVQHIEKDYENIVKRLDSTQNLFCKTGVSRRIIRIIEKTMIMTKNKKCSYIAATYLLGG